MAEEVSCLLLGVDFVYGNFIKSAKEVVKLMDIVTVIFLPSSLIDCSSMVLVYNQ